MKIKKIFFLILITLISIENVIAEINDSLFMTIGNEAIPQSDVVNEIKILLILNNESYSEEKREQLQKTAINSIIKRKIKKKKHLVNKICKHKISSHKNNRS